MAGGQRDGGGGGRGRGLAQRFRAALDARAAAGRRAADQERRRKARVEQARRELLADLEGFGTALGHADVTANSALVVIRLGDRSLRFAVPEEGEGVTVSGDGLRDGWRLEFNDELARWGLYPPHGAVRPLFDKGLEELLVRVFELRPVVDAVSDGEDSSRDPAERPKRSL